MKEASICVIEDDLIKGFKRDSNVNFIIKFLHRFSINVRQICIYGDCKRDIYQFIKDLSEKSDIVIITGGTGEKHYVQTYEAIAESLNLKLIQTNGLINTNDNCKSIPSMLPESASILNNTSDKLPIVKIANLYFFPGCPIRLRASLNQFHRYFLTISETLIFTRYLHINSNYATVTELIDKIVDMFKTVKFYTNICDEKTSYKIILESMVLKDVLVAEKYLKEQFQVLGMKQELACNIYSIYEFARTSNIFIDSIKILEKCFTVYKPEEIFLSFNGGKDCTVLLHLAMAVFNNKFLFENKPKIQCIYIQSKEEPFEEIVQFIEETVESYNLSLIKVQGTIQEALDTILKEEPKYKAVLMGTRRSDPFADKLEYFQMTDKSWPQIMRVSPILDWNYFDVWEFLHDLQIPYCSLYDQGYTSLGHKNNTEFNSALQTTAGYLPAYILEDGSLEREGRISNSVKNIKIS